MSHAEADRNLLFGITALQNDFITRDALIAAMGAWAMVKHRSLGEILVEAKALDPLDRDWLEGMFARRLARHDDDPAAGLAALSSAGAVADDLRRSIADPDVLRSVAYIPPDSGSADPFATRATIPPEPPRDGVRFRKLREHAAGNLGVIYVAHDEELNREVALKEIKERNADHLHSQAKFLLEAEVTGGLEHPGIVPVYGLGHHDDGRPYYAMRFIRGKSLLDAIKRFHADEALKSDPGARLLALQKLLRRFTDVCNAVAYAHSRGVLHRDLKPDNVMVGKYGETLVVDWGLAKALGRSGEPSQAAEDLEDPLPEASLQPSSADGLEATQAGSLVGTPAYMSPEQAAGRLDLLGPASDIYGLGATLYHLIVGHPPISATTLGEILAKIQAGEVPRPRNPAPWIDPALEAICLKAMALKLESRYATPRALAEDLDRWIAGEPVAAYPEPFTRQTSRWAKKHRTSLVAVGSAAAVAAALLGSLTWLRIEQQRRVDASALVSLRESNALAIEARATGDTIRWEKAIAEALRAGERLESGGGSPALLGEVSARLKSLRAEQERRLEALASERADREVVAALEEARLLASNVKEGRPDDDSKLDAYLAAFRAYGIDPASEAVEEVARRVGSSRVSDELIAALEDWSQFSRSKVPATRLAAIARAADVAPAAAEVRDAIARGDAISLHRLCESEEVRGRLGEPRLRRVFYSLLKLDAAGNFPLLEAILRDNPSDFWLNHDLGMAYSMRVRPTRLDLAVHHVSVAVALRPDSPSVHYNLAYLLYKQEKVVLAEAEFRAAIRRKPDFAFAHSNLGSILMDQGRLDEAVAEYREAIRLQPDDQVAAFYLDQLLQFKQDREAVAPLRQVVRDRPGDFDARMKLGPALKLLGDYEGAEAEIREAIRLRPDDSTARNELGNVLFDLRRLDEAIGEFREASRIRPDDAEALCSLGTVLREQGSFREALPLLERGHELGRKRADWIYPSGDWVRDCRRAVEIESRLPAFVSGDARPERAQDWLSLAQSCSARQFHAASAQFYVDCFAAMPSLFFTADHAYMAARSAAMAGAGRGENDLAPNEEARTGLRRKALAWLQSRLLVDQSMGPRDRQKIARTLSHWRQDPDLAGIRDEADLSRLPEEEREAFRAFWLQFDRVLARARARAVSP